MDKDKIFNRALWILILSVIAYFAIMTPEVSSKELLEVETNLSVEEFEERFGEIIITREYIPRTVEEEIKYVFKKDWKLAYAVMMSEGREKPKAINYNTDYCKRLGRSSIDRGIWQINDCWHPEVSKECAYDVQCSTKEAYRISKGGTNWKPWYGFTKGGYKKFL